MKIGKYYYVINFFNNKDFSLINHPIVKFKYTRNLVISDPKIVYKNFKDAKNTLLKELNKKVKKYKKSLNKIKLYRGNQQYAYFNKKFIIKIL